MPAVIDVGAGDAIDLGDAAAWLDERGLDFGDAASVADGADLLARLSRNREFLADMVIDELKAEFGHQARTNRYSAQVFMLHRARRYYIRANLWPADTDAAVQTSGAGHFAYHLPHDHAFSFLTVGHFGPGYVSDDWEHDGGACSGHAREVLNLRPAGRNQLGEGTVMLYRAHRDIHCQRPPASLSVSLNIIAQDVGVPWRDQFVIDLATGTVVGTQTVSGAETLLRCAVHVGGGDAIDLAHHVARRHPVPRVRASAHAALAGAAPDLAQRLAILESAMADGHARVRAECAARIAALSAPLSALLSETDPIACR